MNEDFGSDYITIEDETGEEFELELISALEYNGQEYRLFLPADLAEDDPEFGYIILRIEQEDGEEIFLSVDEDAELVAVYDLFMEQLFDEEDEDASEGEDEEQGE